MRAPRRCLLVMLQATILSTSFWFAAAPGLAQPAKSADGATLPSHIDIYGGYAYIRPFDSYIGNVPYHAVGNINTTVNITDYFSRHLGIQVEGTYFSGGSKRGVAYQCSPSCSSRDQLLYAAEAGPIFRMPKGRFTPYLHVLAGGARVNGPYAQALTWGEGLTGGGGLDYTLPFAGNHLAIRLFQLDMYYSHVDYGHQADYTRGGVGDVLAVKGSAGLVLKFGSLGEPPPPLTLACTVQPQTAYPGDLVAVTCTPGNLEPKRKADYSFTTSGGRLTTNGPTANVSTTSLAPGTYTVNAHLTQGAKPYQQASWSGGFTVRPYDPPSVACSVSPAEITSGDSATVTATATSPQNRPLTYSYSASAGQVSGTGPTATFSSPGLTPGSITLTCNATDDQGRSSSASTTVVIVPRPTDTGAKSNGNGSASRALCSISFTRDRKRPVRVNNEAKACLDDIALTLNREVTDKLLIVGHQNPDEQPLSAAARARNESLYLEQEKGIDASRLELRTGDSAGQSVDNLLLPIGASPQTKGTKIVDPATIPQNGEAYGRPHGGNHVRQGRHTHGSKAKQLRHRSKPTS